MGSPKYAVGHPRDNNSRIISAHVKRLFTGRQGAGGRIQ